MKRLLLTLICCSPLMLSPVSSFALDSTLAASAETPSYQKYGPIRYYESLWSVSKKLRPNRSVSVQQTLVAIYKLNPTVFVDGDINHLIENSVINVPSYQLIKQQTNQEAIILINKYANLTNSQTGNIKRANERIVKPLPTAEDHNPATESVITLVTQQLDAGDAALTETLNSATSNEKNYLANAQLSDNKSLQNPSNGALIEPATSPAGETQQTDQENVALPAAAMLSDAEVNNPDNGSLPAISAAADSDTVSPVQLQALKNELDRVNTQLLATVALNADLKSGLHLLINEIDILKNQIDSESAAQTNLIKQMQQYGIELNLSQSSAFDIGNVNTRAMSWVTASLTNLLIVIASPLLLAILVFSLLLHRHSKRLLAKNNKQIDSRSALSVAPDSETKELPTAESIPETENALSTSSLDNTATVCLTSNATPTALSKCAEENTLPCGEKNADEFDNIGSAFVAAEARQITPAPRDNKQSEPETLDLISELSAAGHIADQVNVDEQLISEAGEQLSEDTAMVEIEDPEQESDVASVNTIKPAQANNTIKLKNSPNYIDIETLLQNSEGDSPDELYTDLNVDLGLDEFPDMLSAHSAIDIDDDNHGISAKLDLARAYLEIDDKASARVILIASLENSNAEQRKEIDKLLTRLEPVYIN